MSAERKKRGSRGRDQSRSVSPSIETNIRGDIASLRQLYEEKELQNAKLRKKESSEFKRYTLIASLSTFYAMAAAFFFSGYDIFGVIAKTHVMENSLLSLKSHVYLFAGILEVAAVFICALGVLTVRKKFFGMKLKWSEIQLVVSLVLGTGLLPLFVLILGLFG